MPRLLVPCKGTTRHTRISKTPGNYKAYSHLENTHKAQDSGTIVTSLPRTGTIWLKPSAYAIVNHKNLVGIDCQNLISSDPHALVPIFEYKVNGTSQLPDFSGLPSPRPFTTHVPYSLLPESIKSSKCRVLYICHNPGVNFVSLWRMQVKLGLNCLKTHLTCIAKESGHVVHTGSMCWDTGNKA
ncbi:cytosolic sulfotransferase 14-like [Coffea arabica]|uniref:Sulfotransferase n=1 Tax=Coffea arabica TaxID=13443 RepID=A0A6P6TRK9_COFAR|nr:cytosolic sulfotransferase 14-like [Coffea arabica]